jgi:ABC-type dipeptide/oligopeptide/nickel transport system permease component
MGSYLLRRLALFIPTLLGVVTVVFFLSRALPGDPVQLMLGESAPLQRKADLRRSLHLDEPLAAQYLSYLGGLARGRLGASLRTGRPVSREILEAFPRTLELGLASLGFACLLALPMGILAARRPGGKADAAARVFSTAGLSLPSFFTGPVLLLAFAVWWPILPVSGADEPGALLLPCLTLALPLAALLTRLLRAALAEEERAEYLRTARMKGLGEGRVLWAHALRNASLPVVTVLGLQFSAVLTGAILTEKVFRWPGLGTLVLRAIASRDYPLLQGAVLFFAFVALVSTLLTDLVYGLLDPRVRHG